ncbi:MAG TPA: type VI secretion system protein TssA [Paraburkholderia sp.]|jgi:type VI secretion system protein ImpA|nr:type VI secretion system protein TssA [Paraburkholderia sp.]
MNPDYAIEALLQPIAGDARGGISLLHDPQFDAIRSARREDDASLPTGIWQTDLKVADWRAVEAGCRRLLAERSKDLTLAAWLGESWLHLYGWQALPHCFALLTELCERFWDDLHPLPRDGDQGYRAAPLAWLGNAYADLLAARVELFEGRDEMRGTLAQWRAAQREALTARARQDVPAAKREAAERAAAKLTEAARAASPELMQQHYAALAAARTLIERLDAWCTPRLGDEAPSFATLVKTIGDAELVLMECLAMHPNVPPPAAPAAADASAAGDAPAAAVAPAVATPTAPRMPQSRDDAYRQLAMIADYLMRYEPHSPVPYMIERALEWGGKPLPQLLKELMASGQDGQSLWTVLGLLPGVPEKTR